MLIKQALIKPILYFSVNYFKMKKILLFTLICTSIAVKAQITSNVSFEIWTNAGNYEEPSGGWTTLNKLRDLSSFSPVTVTKSTDSYSGTYAAKLETKEISGFGTLIGGLLASGVFDGNASPGQNVKLGQPYTGRPANFNVYYKYSPVSNDSAAFYLALTKWNTSTNQRDTIGEAFYTELNTVSTYTQLNIPIFYYSTETPDTIAVLFGSSAAADNFQGQVGSTLYIDELTLPNTVGINELLFNEVAINTFPNPTSDELVVSIQSDKTQQLIIYNANGQEVFSSAIFQNKKIDVSSWTNGAYYISIKDGKGLVSSAKFVKK